MMTAKRPRIPARLAPVGTRHAPAITRQIPRLFSDEEILSLLNERAGSDGRLPRNAYAQTREHGEPTAHCIELRFGTWNQAIVAAGLIEKCRKTPCFSYGDIRHVCDKLVGVRYKNHVSDVCRCTPTVGLTDGVCGEGGRPASTGAILSETETLPCEG